ncbi:uncharacterized protein LOC119987670 [Tripterygium wilfordii]|uniref:uncharacterized protein LOC119987670 n=1 Tax=Tripterygium wilfordii TaxID=458696 RepID=UPI0018F80D0D|nr:uncharacterized protein LOC119987670 [Tripterygium wilfordii]
METPPFLNGQSSPPPQGPTKAAKPGRARNPNNKNPKKTPQRGMGVAQLERLRRQERWKNMAEIKSDNQTQYLPISPAVVGEMVPLGGYPVQWNYSLGVPMIRGDGGGFGLGHGLVYSYGSGAPERMNVLESSKELSSMPNLPHSQSLLLDCCCNNASCYKKKRTNQENIGDKFNPETNFSMSDSEFLGFSLDNTINGGISGFDATHKLNEGVGVVAVHRRAKGMMGDSVVMEYDFLLGNKSERPSKELPRFAMEAGPSAASSVVDGCESSYNPVDLSLKLSF